MGAPSLFSLEIIRSPPQKKRQTPWTISQQFHLVKFFTIFPEVDRRLDSGCDGLIAAQIRVVSLAASAPWYTKDQQNSNKNTFYRTRDSNAVPPKGSPHAHVL